MSNLTLSFWSLHFLECLQLLITRTLIVKRCQDHHKKRCIASLSLPKSFRIIDINTQWSDNLLIWTYCKFFREAIRISGDLALLGPINYLLGKRWLEAWNKSSDQIWLICLNLCQSWTITKCHDLSLNQFPNVFLRHILWLF